MNLMLTVPLYGLCDLRAPGRSFAVFAAQDDRSPQLAKVQNV